MKTRRKELLLSKNEDIKLLLKCKLNDMHSVSKGFFVYLFSVNKTNYILEFKFDEISNIDFNKKTTVKTIARDCDCLEVSFFIDKSKKETNTMFQWNYNGDDED